MNKEELTAKLEEVERLKISSCLVAFTRYMPDDIMSRGSAAYEALQQLETFIERKLHEEEVALRMQNLIEAEEFIEANAWMLKSCTGE